MKISFNPEVYQDFPTDADLFTKDQHQILNLSNPKLNVFKSHLINFLFEQNLLEFDLYGSCKLSSKIDTRKFSWEIENLVALIFNGKNTNSQFVANVADTVFYDVITNDQEYISVKTSNSGNFADILTTQSPLKAQSMIGALLTLGFGLNIKQKDIVNGLGLDEFKNLHKTELKSRLSEFIKIWSKFLNVSEDNFKTNPAKFSICNVFFTQTQNNFNIHFEKTRIFSELEFLNLICDWVGIKKHTDKYLSKGILQATNSIIKEIEKDKETRILQLDLSNESVGFNSLIINICKHLQTWESNDLNKNKIQKISEICEINT